MRIALKRIFKHLVCYWFETELDEDGKTHSTLPFMIARVNLKLILIGLTHFPKISYIVS